jgi:hypothetical protein
MGQIDREITGANRRLAKKRVQCLIEALCFVSSSVLADSLVLLNPLLRQAPKRWHTLKKEKTNETEISPFRIDDNWTMFMRILRQ